MHACADGSDGDINFSWEIMGLDEHNRTHTFSEVLTRTCAELLGEPLMNVSVVNVMGRQLSKGDSGSYSSYPRRYLRFSLFYDPESSTGPSYVDVVRDGQIDVYDVVAVTGMYGLDIESTTNWTDINYYDVTGDGSIDIYDIVAVSNHYGKSVHYLLPIDPRNVLAKFYYANGTLCSESNLDIEGCVVFPEQARTVKLYNGSEGILVRGMYEEFGDLYEEEKTTDFLGLSESSSSPTAKGVHLVQTKVCSSFEAIQVRFGLDLNANRTVVCDRLSLLQYFCVVRNPTSLDLSHSPRNATGAASVTVIAYLVDEFRSKPISNALIEFELYKKMGNDEELVADYDESTNSSGVALFCFEPSSFRYRVEARFSENETFFGSSGSVYVDARIFTQLNITVDIDGDGTLETLIGSNSFFADLGVGIPYEFEAEVIPEQGPNGPMGTIRVYVNGDSYANISHSDHFFWTAQTEGAYDFRMFYEGDDETRPCEWKFVVDVEVLPLLVYFDATPRKFKPGDIISLHALAVVANTNQTFAGSLTFKFFEDGYNLIHEVNASNGEANADWTYPTDGEAHTASLRVQFLDGTQIPQIIEPIRLEVFQETKLLFQVERNNSSEHVFHGRLLTTSGEGVASQPIKIYLNGRELSDVDLTTNATGHFSFKRNFNSGGLKISYTVDAAYWGSGSKTANLTATDFMGRQYEVCFTWQISYRRSCNMTRITIEPQVSEVTSPTETPEDLQEEAESSGELEAWGDWGFSEKTVEELQEEAEESSPGTWGELVFGWPFYRQHFKFTVNGAVIHLAFNPVIPGGEIFEHSGLEDAVPKLTAEPGMPPEEAAQIVEEIVVEVTLGLLAGATFAAAAHYTTQLAMLGYGALLSIFCLIAYDLYKSGAILKAKAFLGTLVIDLWGTALSTCLPLSTAVIFDAVVFNILGVVASNLIEPLSLKAALITANGVLLAGLTIGLASLLIPEPTSITFRLWFQVITLLFSAFALGILLAW